MADILRTLGCVLTASDTNVFEAFAIQSAEERRGELDVIVRLAGKFVREPMS
jgi:hypothetical protein